MQRRQFIGLLGGTAVAWPLSARGQQSDRVKRIAWVGTRAEDEVTFGKELAKLGWIEGRNVRVDYHLGVDVQRVRTLAPEIVGAAPDLILTVGTDYTEIFKQLTDMIPIVFENVADPVASRFVANFDHPGGNITGFSNMEFSFAGKWLSILRELVPDMANVMMLYEPANSNWQGFLATLEAAGQLLGVAVRAAPATVTADVDHQIETFVRDRGGGMVVIPTSLTVTYRETIAALAARHRLPAIYALKFFVTSGGLVSYGSDDADLTRRATQYVDRILKGAKPADLPAQAPTKFELVINAKAAMALHLTIPPTLLAIADEVIE